MALSSQPYVFSQIGLDSAALTLLGGVVRQFSTPGEYRGWVNGAANGPKAFYLTVDESPLISGVHIDLAALTDEPPQTQTTCSCGTAHDSASGGHFRLGAGGHAVFHIGGGPGGLSATVERVEGRDAADGAEAPERFDSTRLSDGDLFTATLLRPGRYRARNLAQRRTQPTEIDVRYPPATSEPFKVPPPVRVESARGGFSRRKIELVATQTCIFVCEAPSHIKIDLESPHDPPSAEQALPAAGRRKRKT
jgi:hypothetical protein